MNTPDILFTPPTLLFLDITMECNLRCKHCHLWMTKDDLQKRIPTSTKIELLKQFKALNPQGLVVLVGGEPLRNMEEFFVLSKLCRELDLQCSSNTNASYIDDALIPKLFYEGPHYIQLSLDSHIEKVHDWVRGVKGNYQQVTSSLKKLTKFKKENAPDYRTFIQTNTVLFDENIELWEDYIEFAKSELEVEATSFQLLSHTFANHAPKDHFYEKHSIKDIDKANTIIDNIIKKYGDDPFVVTTKNDLEWMKMVLKNPEETEEQVCGASERNLIINQYGEVRLCFNMHEITDAHLGNICDNSIIDILNSTVAIETREIMSNCRLNCGMLSCNRKTDFAEKLENMGSGNESMFGWFDSKLVKQLRGILTRKSLS